PFLGGDPLLEPLPRRDRVGVEARTAPAPELGDDEALVLEPGEHFPEGSRDGNPPLVVDQVLMGTAEHSQPCGASLPYHPEAPFPHRPPHPSTNPHRGALVGQVGGACQGKKEQRRAFARTPPAISGARARKQEPVTASRRGSCDARRRAATKSAGGGL